MRKRWQVVVIGDGWDYRDADLRYMKFITRRGANQKAKRMNELGFRYIPLKYVVEPIPPNPDGFGPQ